MANGRDLQARLREVATEMERRVRTEMAEMADEVLEDARSRAPRDTGELAESGYVEQAPDGRLVVGFRADHAAVQHERLDWEHPGGGEPKFLERALDEAARGAQARLADAAREAL